MSDDHHIVPTSLYIKIFGALMLLTAITVWVSGIDMGVMNTPVAMTIALIKAALVLSIFMHLKYSPPLLAVIAVTGFLWLAVMLGITMADYKGRTWLPDPAPFAERHLPTPAVHHDSDAHADDHDDHAGHDHGDHDGHDH